MATLYEEIVSAIDGVSGGPYPGRRTAHAKGIHCEGSFTATPRAAELLLSRVRAKLCSAPGACGP